MLNVLALGLTLGIIQGLSYFFLTIFHIIRGKGPMIHFMGHHLRGYRRNLKGAIISLLWGFLFGLLTGVLIALFYNLFIKLLDKI
jgi:hypothetical protein